MARDPRVEMIARIAEEALGQGHVPLAIITISEQDGKTPGLWGPGEDLDGVKALVKHIAATADTPNERVVYEAPGPTDR